MFGGSMNWKMFLLNIYSVRAVHLQKISPTVIHCSPLHFPHHIETIIAPFSSYDVLSQYSPNSSCRRLCSYAAHFRNLYVNLPLYPPFCISPLTVSFPLPHIINIWKKFWEMITPSFECHRLSNLSHSQRCPSSLENVEMSLTDGGGWAAAEQEGGESKGNRVRNLCLHHQWSNLWIYIYV